MKSIHTYIIALITGIIAVSCSSDDDNTPVVINAEEVISTLRVQLTDGNGAITTLQSFDADGDGPNAPVITIVGDITPNTTYAGTVAFLNEIETPVEDITEEVEEEDDEHQVFFTPASGLDVATTYGNFDGDGNPLGTVFTLTTGDASTGNFTVTLRHEPTKPNTGLADAGGDTDIEVTFSIEVE
jgi:hypothetical protein